jgi:hypothetical protein
LASESSLAPVGATPNAILGPESEVSSGQKRGVSLVEVGEGHSGLGVPWILPAWDTEVILDGRESAADVILGSWSSLEDR